MAIGHSADSHKLPLSFAVWFAIGVALRMIGSGIFALAFFSDLYFEDFLEILLSSPDIRGDQLVLCLSILRYAVQDAAFYLLTRYFMKNKLNLP